MTQYVIKILVTTALVVLVSEVARRSTIMAAVLASVPIVSVLAMIWLYVETDDVARVAALARSVVWLVLPSLILFVALPILIERGFGFYLSLGVSVAATVIGYVLVISIIRRVGIAY